MKKLLLILFVLILSAPNWGDIIFEDQKLLPDDGEEYDFFGSSVSISNDYLIVGADGNFNGIGSGSAYIYKLENYCWGQQIKLFASNGQVGDNFGSSVSISGDYALVGAYYADVINSLEGAAYVYYRDGDSWIEQAILVASDGDWADNFGYSVSISGDYAIIGARNDDDYGNISGAAYIFHRYGENWVEQIKLTASDASASDRFGTSVSICGDYAAIGANYNDGCGAVYIFKLINDNWVELAKLTASDPTNGNSFGYSVCIYEDNLIVGSNGDDIFGDSSGSAYIFERVGETWSQEVKVYPADGVEYDNFGRSVSITDNHAIVGCQCFDNRGSVYVYTKENDLWIGDLKLLASDGEPGIWDPIVGTYLGGDVFGCSVGISRPYVIIGAFGDNNEFVSSGSAYYFNFNNPPELTEIDDIIFDEDNTFSFNLNDYFIDPDSWDSLEFSYFDNENIFVEINEGICLLTPIPNWNGAENITFSATDTFSEPITDEVLVTVNPINDPPEIISFTPVETEIIINQYEEITFEIVAQDIDSDLEFSWCLNDTNLNNFVSTYSHEFIESGDFLLKVIVSDGEYSLETIWNIQVINTISEDFLLPFSLQLSNYPNPFNPTTTISFNSTSENTELLIYNLKGQRIRQYSILNGQSSIIWNGTDSNEQPVSSGIYFYKLVVNGKTETVKKCLLLK